MQLPAEALLLRAEALLLQIEVKPEVVKVMPQHIEAKFSDFKGKILFLRDRSLYTPSAQCLCGFTIVTSFQERSLKGHLEVTKRSLDTSS